jgi:hypothetical protein
MLECWFCVCKSIHFIVAKRLLVVGKKRLYRGEFMVSIITSIMVSKDLLMTIKIVTPVKYNCWWLCQGERIFVHATVQEGVGFSRIYVVRKPRTILIEYIKPLHWRCPANSDA